MSSQRLEGGAHETGAARRLHPLPKRESGDGESEPRRGNNDAPGLCSTRQSSPPRHSYSTVLFFSEKGRLLLPRDDAIWKGAIDQGHLR